MEGRGNDGCVLRLLHHRVVDGDIRAFCESRLVEADEVEILDALDDSFAGGLEDIGGKRGHLAEQLGDREHEHAGVPVEAAGCQHLLGLRERWLLDEALDGKSATRERLAAFDIAIAGCRFRRFDAEGDELACGCGGNRGAHRVEIDVIGIDLVIRSQHMHDRALAEAVAHQRAGGGNGGGRVAGHRLQKDARQRQIELAGLLGDQEAEFLVGDDDRRFIERLVGDAQQCLLKKGGVADEADELLGGGGARQRPETRALAACHDYRNDLLRHLHWSSKWSLIVDQFALAQARMRLRPAAIRSVAALSVSAST